MHSSIRGHTFIKKRTKTRVVVGGGGLSMEVVVVGGGGEWALSNKRGWDRKILIDDLLGRGSELFHQ